MNRPAVYLLLSGAVAGEEYNGICIFIYTCISIDNVSDIH